MALGDNRIIIVPRFPATAAKPDCKMAIIDNGDGTVSAYMQDGDSSYPSNPAQILPTGSPLVAPAGFGSVSGLGTTGRLTKWTNGAASVIGNSILAETAGDLVQQSGNLQLSGAVIFPDGIRQIFNPDAVTPGINVGSFPGDPSTPINGDLWYDSTANELMAQINGATLALSSGTPGGSDQQIQFNDGGVFGGSTRLLFDKTTGIMTVARVANAAVLAGINGSNTNVVYGRSASVNTGIYFPGTNQVGISANGIAIANFGGGTLNLLTNTVVNDTFNFVFNSGTGSKLGTDPTQKVAFYGAAPVAQGAAIPDAAGGAVIDVQARAALNALLAAIRLFGVIAP